MSAYDVRRPVTPVVDVLVGGFCGSAAGYEELRDTMYRATGNTTVYVGMTRFGLMFRGGHPLYPRALYRQALHLKRSVRKYAGRQLRLYGHSMGGAVTLIATDAFGPAMNIERVVALNPAGLYVDGAIPLGRRVLQKAKSDSYFREHHADPQVRRIIRASEPGKRYYLSNPLRSLAEGLALGHTPLFTQIMPRMHGRPVRVVVGYSEKDIVFKPAQIAEALTAFPGIDSFMLDATLHDMQYTPTSTVNMLCRHGAL